FGRPPSLDRAFTTQAARHSEFNVNLAHVDLTLATTRARGRLAVQTGTSVQANYAAEPRVGALSGPDVSRFIQEATLGYQVVPRLWIDAGIFFAPFGSESWISADNWTYTRSLVADNSPYYESGAKVTWSPTARLGVQLHVMNGWQNVSENNADKALGVRVDYAAADRVSLAYDAFAGNEQPSAEPGALRLFQEVIARARIGSRLSLSGTFDYGIQRQSAARSAANWHGWAMLARLAVTPRSSVTARIEAYSDLSQIIVVTGRRAGFRANGGSLTLNVAAD